LLFDLLLLFFRTLKLTAAFIAAAELYIEVLCLIVRIFFCHPNTMLGRDIPDGIMATKWAAD
jgi:hypothetical protein